MNGSPTPLLDRIDKRRREVVVLPRQSANVIPFQRRQRAAWIDRMEQRGLPAKDYTEGPDAA